MAENPIKTLHTNRILDPGSCSWRSRRSNKGGGSHE